MNTAFGIKATGTTTAEAALSLKERPVSYIKYIPLSNFRFHDDGHAVIDGNKFELTRTAVENLAGFTGVPSRYLLNAPNDVVAWTLNHFLPGVQQNVHVALEESKSTILSIVEEGRNPILTVDLLERLPQDKFTSWSRDELGFSARLTLDTLPIEPRLGDVMKVGIEVLAHELQGVPGVRSLLYRLVCTNGAIAPENRSARKQFLKDAWLSDDARIDHMLDSFEAQFDNAIELSVGLHSLPNLAVDPFTPFTYEETEKLMRKPLRLIGLPSAQAAYVTAAWQEEENSLYGLYNAVTRVGRDAGSRRAKDKFEGAGFSIVRKAEAVHEAILKSIEIGAVGDE